jgi:hypothetical protein
MTAPANPGAIAVFFSYSHKDEALRDKLATHLKLLERQGVIQQWHDRQILAGTEWKGEIDGNLEAAQIILLLISADFLASDYCYDLEMGRALERHDARESRVIPIVLRPVDNLWKAPFGKLQALPTDGKAVTLWDNQDAAFADVAKGIRLAAEAWQRGERETVSQSRESPESPVINFNLQLMHSNRLHEIEDNLSLLREQLVGMEKSKIMAPAEERPRIEQRIRRELKVPIKQYEEEYWQILALEADALPISEPDAEVAIAEIVEQVHQFELHQPATYSDEALQILREIRDKLNQPGSPATAKLKGIISSIPPFIGVSYEAELDTENFFRVHFPTFTRLIKGGIKK